MHFARLFDVDGVELEEFGRVPIADDVPPPELVYRHARYRRDGNCDNGDLRYIRQPQ